MIGLGVVIALVFALIGVRLVDVQAIDQGHYRQLGVAQRVHTVTVAPERGSIFDRNGNDLALTVAASSIYADPRNITDPAGYAAKLAPLVGIDADTLAARLGQNDKAFVYVARQMDVDVVAKVRALHLAWIGFVPESKRYYPSGTLAAPLLGFVGTDNNGLAGLESGNDKALAGRAGKIQIEQDPKGRELPNGQTTIRSTKRGTDLVLTIDQSLQYQTERVLTEEVTKAKAKGGMAIVADVRTGQVLAMATIDGATATSPAHPASASESNRPLTDVFEPGSTNKVVTIAAALEAGLVNANTVLQVPQQITVDGQVYADVDPHPLAMTVADIVRESSNVGTILIAQMLGKERFDAALRAFGFGAPTGLGFPGEAAGILLPLNQYNATSMASMPIGSGIAVTAMQMLDVYLTVANQGAGRAPQLVSATIDAQGKRHDVASAPTHQVVSSSTASTVAQILSGVVTSGTGVKAQIPGYTVAGKTGTARKPPYDKPPYQYVADFVGFAPAQSPRLAAIVVMDSPQGSIFGGDVAAPAFARIMQYALDIERVPASS